MHIVPLAPQHLEQVADLEAQAGDVQWTRGQFERELSIPFSRFWVLEEEDQVIGYGGFWKVVDEAQISNLVISLQRRRQGLGSRLLKHFLAEAQREGCIRSTLEVRIGNKAARFLYEQAGFVQVGLRPTFYSSPIEDAVIMEKRL